MQTGVSVLDWNLCEAEKPILFIFLVIAEGNKASLYHEATGVPCHKKNNIKKPPTHQVRLRNLIS